MRPTDVVQQHLDIRGYIGKPRKAPFNEIIAEKLLLFVKKYINIELNLVQI